MTNLDIPPQFAGVKLTKDGKPDTRSKLGRAYAEYLKGKELADDSRRWADSDARANFAPEGADAPADAQVTLAPTPEPESPPIDPWAYLNDPPPPMGSHALAKEIIRYLVARYPNAKRGDWHKMAHSIRAVPAHVRTWNQLKPPGGKA